MNAPDERMTAVLEWSSKKGREILLESGTARLGNAGGYGLDFWEVYRTYRYLVVASYGLESSCLNKDLTCSGLA